MTDVDRRGRTHASGNRDGATLVTLESRPGHGPGEFVPGPLVETDPVFVAAVDEAVIGDVFADSPEAQPERKLVYTTDFSSLYIRHRSSLAIYARRFLSDSRDIDEVVQETFLRLFLASSEIETELQAIAFARRTLTNLCIDRYRAERRRPQLVNLDTSAADELEVGSESEDAVVRAEDAAVVREALAMLSPLHRAALIKREIEEKPLPQIAAELDVPEDSVKHLLFRARRALRRLLVGTSVEPGVELSVGEVVGIANRRAARAVLQSANALMILFVGTLVIAFGLKGFIQQPDRAVTSEAASESSGGVIVPAPVATNGGPPSGPTGGQSGHSGHHGSTTTPSVGPTQSPVAPSPQHTGTAPTHPTAPPVHPTKPASPPPSTPPSSGPPKATLPRFALSGPLQVQGTPSVHDVGTTVTADNTQTSVSQFSAPTSAGTFSLTQTLTQQADGTPTVTVSPVFQIGNQLQQPQLTGTTSSVVPNPDGTVTVNVVAAAQPNRSTNAFPLTSMTAHYVLSATLDHVLRETVTVQGDPTLSGPPTSTPTPTPTTSASGSLSGPYNPGAATSNAPDTTSATAGLCTGGADTNSPAATGTGLGVASVIRISAERDDQFSVCAFYSRGGGLSQVPTSPEGP